MTSNAAEKRCPTCQQTKSTEHFHKNRARRDGLASHCKDCQKTISRKHYESNKPAYYTRNKRAKRKQSLEILEMKKNTPCKDCGGSFHPYIMEFDHRDPETKLFSIARRGKIVYKKLRDELAKCDLVCANCHKLRTFRRMQSNPDYKLADVA